MSDSANLYPKAKEQVEILSRVHEMRLSFFHDKQVWPTALYIGQEDFYCLLREAARHTGCKVTEGADRYLAFVEDLKQVTSRQIAALSIATAFALYPPSAAGESHEEKK